jgi:Glycosyltransferase family 87
VELRPPAAPGLISRLALVAGLALCALAGGMPAAAAAEPTLKTPSSRTEPPRGYRLSADGAKRIASQAPKIRAERPRHRRFEPTVYTRGPGRWQVSFFAGRDEVAQVRVDDGSGAVLEQWTGHQVAWTMARGYEGAFGRTLNAPWVWLPLCALFLFPFIDPRRPRRMLHLDLLVLLGFGVSHVFFNRGEIGISVPLVYPVLGYLLARLLWLAGRPRRGRGRLVPVVPLTWLTIGLVLLVGFRVGLNVIDANVIDVGYAGAIGADRIGDGDPLYGEGFHGEVERGDTYGPLAYLAYVPFEQVLPWSGSWDDLPAAHGAALAFDLLTLAGLVLLGRRLRPGPAGRELGLALGWAWASYPYALFALQTNSNDSLVALATVLALLGLTLHPARRGLSAVARGAAVGLGAASKFVPLALAPLFATGAGGRARVRHAAVFAGALALVLVAAVAPFVPDGGLRELYDRTVGYQAGRDSPFSVWGQLDEHGWALHAVQGLGVGLAVAVAFVGARRDAFGVAALGAAVLIALQLGAVHWFYLYIVWFAPMALVALLGAYSGAGPGSSTWSIETATPSAEASTSTPLSQGSSVAVS